MTSHSMCDAEPVAPEIPLAGRLSLNCKDLAENYACNFPVSKTLLLTPFLSRLCEHKICSSLSKSFKADSLRKRHQKNILPTSFTRTVFSILYPQSLENITMRDAFERGGRRIPGRKRGHFVVSFLGSLLVLSTLCLAQAQRGTLVHEESIRVSPSGDTAKLGTVE